MLLCKKNPFSMRLKNVSVTDLPGASWPSPMNGGCYGIKGSHKAMGWGSVGRCRDDRWQSRWGKASLHGAPLFSCVLCCVLCACFVPWEYVGTSTILSIKIRSLNALHSHFHCELPAHRTTSPGSGAPSLRAGEAAPLLGLA